MKFHPLTKASPPTKLASGSYLLYSPHYLTIPPTELRVLDLHLVIEREMHEDFTVRIEPDLLQTKWVGLQGFRLNENNSLELILHNLVCPEKETSAALPSKYIRSVKPGEPVAILSVFKYFEN